MNRGVWMYGILRFNFLWLLLISFVLLCVSMSHFVTIRVIGKQHAYIGCRSVSGYTRIAHMRKKTTAVTEAVFRRLQVTENVTIS